MSHKTSRPWALLAALAAGGLLSGCQEAGRAPAEADTAPGPPWFAEIGAARGLDFVHDAGEPSDSYFLPQIMGSGLALFDFDNDGLLDLYLIQNAGPKSKSTNRLYRQLPGGRFQDVSKGSGLDVAGWGMGVV